MCTLTTWRCSHALLSEVQSVPGCKASSQGRHCCHKSSYLSHWRDHTEKGFLLTLSKWEKQARLADGRLVYAAVIK